MIQNNNKNNKNKDNGTKKEKQKKTKLDNKLNLEAKDNNKRDLN